MAKSARARAFEAEHGAPSMKEGQLRIDPSGTSDALIDVVDASESGPTQVLRDVEPHIAEPKIGIEGTRIVTVGGDLASTALKNIMDTFNAASKKGGLDKSTKGEPKHRFYTHFGGASASLPHKVTGFMESNTMNATLDERGVVKVSNPKHQKPPKHLKDLEILNDTAKKRAEGVPEELITEDRERLKKWLIDNYGPQAEQKISYTYGDPVEHKVTHKDREALIEKVRELEEDAKKIANGEILPYGSRPFDATDEPPDPRDYEEEV